MMAGKMKLAQLLRAIGHDPQSAEREIKKLIGVHVDRSLLADLIDERGRRPAGQSFLIARPKIEAVLQWLSDEMGRDIGIHDLADALEVV